jgi:HprK-related kinase A
MLTLSTLAPAELAARLRGPGLALRMGQFTISLRTVLPAVRQGLALLYADYPLAAPDFADFHLAMARGRGLRAWYQPQARFVFDGQEPLKPLPLAHAFPMLEWGMNYCVSAYADSWLLLHAAVVEKHGRAAILPAPPGSGKSTLCAALVQSGWRLLSDELAMIGLADGLLWPNPRPVSLKNASIGVIRARFPDSVFSPAVAGTDKGTVAHLKPPAAAVARAREPARPGWIIYPRYEAGAATSVVPVGRADAFMRTAGNAFNYSILGVHGFDALAGLVERCASLALTYSDLDEALAWFDQLAEAP